MNKTQTQKMDMLHGPLTKKTAAVYPPDRMQQHFTAVISCC